MLWNKQENGIYENICQQSFPLFEKYCVVQLEPKKSNDVSSQYFELGNIQFTSKKWLYAIKLYNASLCFAEIGSVVQKCLAFGSRSLCFLHLNMFEECLADIELAIESNCPARLLPKLEERKARCEEQIRNGVNLLAAKERRSAALGRQVSFEENPNYPGMANVLELQNSDKFGRHITATSDIDAGQIVISEKAFLIKSDGRRNRCDTCWKSNVNLVPCSGCTTALFCRGQCEQSRCHTIQCGMRIVDDDKVDDLQIQLVRSLLMAIGIFDNAKSLMRFVELAVQSDPNEIPESLLDAKSQYRAFLKLPFNRRTTMKATFTTQICFVYETLMNHPTIWPLFETEKHKRFLMHLIGHHLCVVQSNTGALMHNATSPFGVAQSMRENLSLLVNYFNHSCVPNLFIISSDDLNVCITLRPIKAGDQLFVYYFRNDLLKHNSADRQKFLRTICEFDCDCEKCNTSTVVPQELVDELKVHPQYQYVRGLIMDCERCGGNASVVALCSCSTIISRDAKTMVEKCVPLMDKFDAIKCSAEMGLVVRCLEIALKVQFER